MRDFTKQISHREMASFVLPLLFIKLFETVSGTVNTMIVNRLLDSSVITCISACRVYPMLQNYLLGVTAAGFGVYVTRFIGKNDGERLKRAAAEALSGACILMAAGFVLLLVLDPLLMFIKIPADIYGQAKEYLFWLFAGSGALVFQNLCLSILYGLGESAFAGSASAVGVVLQPCLTFLFVRYGNLGIRAVPVAMMVNRLVLILLQAGYLWKNYRHLFGEPSFEGNSLKNWKELWKCGTSGALMLLFIWFGTFLIQREVNQMPASHISAYMYAIMVEDLLLIPIWGCKEAASSILAQNAGAGNVTLFRQYYWRINRICWTACLIILGIIWFWGRNCVRFVVGPADEEVVILANRWLQICAFAFPALAMKEIGRATLQAVGAYRFMGLLGILEGILRMVLAVFVIAGAGFDALIWSFFSIFVCMGTVSGICCQIAPKRWKGEYKIGG